MSQQGIMNFLSVNRSLTNQGGELRQFRLPRMNPFPKLDGRIVRSTSSDGEQRLASRPVARGTVIIEGGFGCLPEMATDVIDSSASYAVENVKRERSDGAPWSRVGFGHLVGRMLGGHRAVRL
ncbi:MAG TPA: hypothetical protein VMV72_14910 [Verrucomicrobiae bacterium]|nr:hypothetical protein [Verrucomicrobiae bacterium]